MSNELLKTLKLLLISPSDQANADQVNADEVRGTRDRDTIQAQLEELNRQHSISLNGTPVIFEIEHSENLATAKKFLETDKFDLCILSHALGEDEQEFAVRLVAKRLKPGRTLMLPVLEKDEKGILLKFVQAGAAGIILHPTNTTALGKVILAALSLLDSPKAPAQEAITSLPWVLESVAARLEKIARAIRERETSGEHLLASSKIVKEALLGAIGAESNNPSNSNTQQDDAAIEKVVEYLLRQSRNNN